MKQTQEYKKAQANMQPGIITAGGFLGHDSRPLSDIIEADEEMMQKLGIDFESIVMRLKEIFEAGKTGLGEPITVQKKWIVRVDETRGTLPSPWEDGIFHKSNVEVELLENGNPTGKTILYNELCIHLIEKFHFFQGIGSPFRLDPATAKAVLDL